MDKEQFLESLNKHDGIYGYMYGRPCREPYDPDEIIFIEKKNLRPWMKNGNQIGWFFIWGGPGPDYNVYLFSDYMKTWAFVKEDIAEPKEDK